MSQRFLIPHPTGSGLPRLKGCPGSFDREKDLDDEDTPESKRGAVMHEATMVPIDEVRAKCEELSLSWQDAETVEQALKIESGLVVETFGQDAMWIDPSLHIIREERLYWHEPNSIIPRFSTQPDVVYHSDGFGLLPDYKMLWGDHPDASVNLQLRAGIVLAADEYHLHGARAAILQPRVTMNPEVVEYDSQHIEDARAEIEDILRTAKESKKIQPGPWCKWCKARFTCGEHQEWSLQGGELELVPEFTDYDTPKTSPAVKALDSMTPDERGAMIPRLNYAMAALEAIYAKLKRKLAENPDYATGYEFQESAKVRTITDNKAVYTALKDFLTPKEILDCATLSITALDDKFIPKYREHMKKGGVEISSQKSRHELNRLLEEAEAMERLPQKGGKIIKRKEALT